MFQCKVLNVFLVAFELLTTLAVAQTAWKTTSREQPKSAPLYFKRATYFEYAKEKHCENFRRIYKPTNSQK